MVKNNTDTLSVDALMMHVCIFVLESFHCSKYHEIILNVNSGVEDTAPNLVCFYLKK